jgi:hypothetical protein
MRTGLMTRLGSGAALALVLVAMFPASLPAADPPGRVNFQGMARDAGGTVLDGPVSMVFKLYDDPAAGTVLWEETYDPVSHPPAVSVSAGLFTVALGDATHRTAGSEASFQDVFANHGAVYLGVKVGEDVEMTPRISVVSAPFAVNSGALDGKGADDFAGAVHTHAAADVTSGTMAVARGGTGLASPGASGNVLTSTGSAWASSAAPSAASTGAVVDAADTTLTRSGAGTAVSPFKLALNLGKANTWTGAQTFQTGAFFPGGGAWTSSGKLGIGTAAPQYALDVLDTEAVGQIRSTSANNGSVLWLRNDTASPDIIGRILFWKNNIQGVISYTGGHNMDFFTNNQRYMTLTSSGNLGLGITNPTANLHIQKQNVNVRFDALNSTPSLTFTGGGGGDIGRIYFGESYMPYGGIGCDAAETLRFQAGMADRMFLTIWGLGIGIQSPAEKLDVYGNANIGDSSTANRLYMKSKEAVWFNGDYFSWGYGGTANRFYRPVGIGGIDPAYQLQLSQNSAAKPVSSVWTVPADLRLNKNTEPFTDGLAVLEKIKPLSFRYNGLAGMPNDAPCIGVIAQEIKDVAPYTVGTFRAKLTERDEAEAELYDFNSHALTFVMINAIKELHAEVAALSGKPAPRGEKEVVKASPVHAAKSAAGLPDPISSDPDGQAAGHAFAPIPERFPVCEAVEAGDVLVNDAAHPEAFCLGRIAGDAGVVGVAAEGVTPQEGTQAEGAGYPLVPMATSGIVPCKVDATYGPVSPNDLLVASPTPGHAMRAQSPQPGTVIGKALEPLQGGTGLIRILVMLR